MSHSALIVRAEHMPAGGLHVPVAIVGGGACGLQAAIGLRDAGIDCLVLERDAQLAGSTALSSGFIPAAGTRVQRGAGVADSAAQFAQDIQTKAKGRTAAHLVAAYVQAIAPALDNLQERHGIGFELLDGFLYPGHSVRRMHAVQEKTGLALVQRMEQAARAAGADILTQARVTQLWVNSAQRVMGVTLLRPGEQEEHLSCDALILACNGFGGNPNMVQMWLPEMRMAQFAGHVGNDGSAIAWGKALGAGMADLSGYQGHGSWAVPQSMLISWALMMEGGIQLNAQGKRFHDETQGYSEAAVHVLAQPGGVAWNVFDEPLLKLGRQFPDFLSAEDAGAVRVCQDTDELAQLIGSDVHDVEFAVRSQSRALGHENSHQQKRALQAPFYAIKVTGALFHTQGGLDIDADCRVLAQGGTPFPNLLAAGGAARGVSGDAVWGYLSGNGLLSAIAGGSIAAQAAARNCKEKT